MSTQIGIAIVMILTLGGCAHRDPGVEAPVAPSGAPSAGGDVPSKRRAVVVPSDPKLNVTGQQPTSATGTEGGRIDSIGKGDTGAGTP